MASSTLDITQGRLPSTAPFDLRDVTHFSPHSLWRTPLVGLRHGDLWIDYPFPESYNGLGANQSDPQLATETKKRIAAHVETIVGEAVRAGMPEMATRWSIEELLTNATQYGQTKGSQRAGLVRLEWRVDNDDVGPVCALAMTNPCRTLFDPSRFARMTIEEFTSLDDTGPNAHVGTIGLISFLAQGTKLCYLWELQSGERVKLYMALMPEDYPQRPANYDELMKPTRVTVEKFDCNNHAVPYTFAQFERAIKSALPAESVTVSCVIAGPRTSENASRS